MRSASECVRRSHRQCLRRPTHSDAERTCRAVGPTQFTPDTTRQSCLCRVWCACVNWTIALNVFRLPHFLSATVLSCRESNSHCQQQSGRDTDKTVLSCLAWRCQLASMSNSYRLRGLAGVVVVSAWTSDSKGRGFKSRSFHVYLRHVVRTRASVTKQYKLVPVKGR